MDFFSHHENEPVVLCWQFGEPGVTQGHAIDEGFAGRLPIEGIELERPEFFN